MRRLLAALVLIGCGDSALHGANGDADLGSSVRVIAADPADGPMSGGDLVLVEGEGFIGEVQVFFDALPAASSKVDDRSLLVTTPPAQKPGPVDLIVSADPGTAVLRDAYTYLDDGTTDPSTDPTTDPTTGTATGTATGSTTATGSGTGTGTGTGTPTGTGTGTGTGSTSTDPFEGLTGGLVQMTHLQIACPVCFDLGDDLQVSAEAAFHDPVAGSWLGWLPPAGSCEINPYRPQLAASYNDVGEWVNLQSGPSQLGLHRELGDFGPKYAIGGLGTEDFLRTAFYDVSVPDGGAFGPFEIRDSVLTPTGFDTLTPWQLLLIDPRDAFTAPFRRGGTTMTWSPVGTGTFVVMFEVFTPLGAPTYDVIVCHGYDSGSLYVPGWVWAPYDNRSLLAVYALRTEHVLTDLPDGSNLEGVTQMGVLGTGFLSP
ncbi:MAG: hypothetical protein ACI9K2_003386 [Myxococcota bacterium]|jgi:hypothetical protein